MTLEATIERWQALGRQGFVISVAYGMNAPAGATFWSVSVMCADGRHFIKPFAARDLPHALEIAEIEIGERGWWKQ